MMPGENATPDALEAVRVRMGLNDSIWMQYLHWLSAVSRGDFGVSMRTDQPVAPAAFVVGREMLPNVVAPIIVEMTIRVCQRARNRDPGFSPNRDALVDEAPPQFVDRDVGRLVEKGEDRRGMRLDPSERRSPPSALGRASPCSRSRRRQRLTLAAFTPWKNFRLTIGRDFPRGIKDDS